MLKTLVYAVLTLALSAIAHAANPVADLVSQITKIEAPQAQSLSQGDVFALTFETTTDKAVSITDVPGFASLTQAQAVAKVISDLFNYQSNEVDGVVVRSRGGRLECIKTGLVSSPDQEYDCHVYMDYAVTAIPNLLGVGDDFGKTLANYSVYFLIRTVNGQIVSIVPGEAG